MLTHNGLLETVMQIVFWCSVASLLLPPVELFDTWPRFKRYYTFAIRIINYYGALNLRGKIAQKYVEYKNGNDTPV